MAAIDVGNAASDRGGSASSQTLIDLGNPANETGALTSVEIWAATSMTGCKVGTFYGSAPNFTKRDSASIGNVTAGSKQTFTSLNISIETGDFIGIYFGTGDVEFDTSGGTDVYYKAGDQFEAGTQTYTQAASDAMSVYGTGVTQTSAFFAFF